LRELRALRESADKIDLEALDQFLFASKRTLNTTQDYTATLMVSADNIDHLLKIPELKADAIVLNLEDGVAKERRGVALRLCAFVLSKLPRCDKKLIVRVNALDDGGAEEIEILNNFSPDAIRIPKIADSSDVKYALQLVASPIEVHLSVESASAWLNLSSLRVDSRVKALYLGILDLYADLGLDHSLLTPQSPTLHYILSHFLITSKAMGLKPISFVYQEYQNEYEFREYLQLERSMGFDAKGALSPSQATMIQLHFLQNKSSLSRAKEIVSIFEKKGSIAHEKHGFIDEPIYKNALNIINKYSP